MNSLERVIKSEESAAFAYDRVLGFFDPPADQPAASECPEVETTLKLLMKLIKNKVDANLALERISDILLSFTASSATSQGSNASQPATSSSSPSSSSTEVATTSLPAEVNSTAPVTSQVPESPSTNSAVSSTTQSQQSSASTKDTTPSPSTEAKSAASIKSAVSQPSPTTAPDADIPQPQKPSASAQDITSPPSAKTKSTALSSPAVIFSPSSMISALGNTSKSQRPSASASNAISPPSIKAESPAPAQSEPVNPSSTTPKAVNAPSTTPAHSKTTQTQQTPASTASPQLPPAQPNGPLNAPGPAQSQQPLAPATSPQPSSAQPSQPRYSAKQLTPSPYSLQPTYSPAHGAPLTYELAVRVGTYQGSTCVVTSKLIEHGGRNHNPPLEAGRRVPLAQRLNYLDYFRNQCSMVVQRDEFEDHNGWEIDIPRVSCNQYLDLYNSMLHHKPDNLEDICRNLLIELEIAIVNRAEVYKWYESLPPTDARVAFNPRHLAFLQMLEKLESAINHYLHTGNTQLIRR